MQAFGNDLAATKAASRADTPSLHATLDSITKTADCIDNDGTGPSAQEQGHPWNCPGCGASISSARAHPRDELFCAKCFSCRTGRPACPLCRREFTRYSAVERHIRVVHKDQPQIRLDEAFATLKKQSSFRRRRRPPVIVVAKPKATKLDHHLGSCDEKQSGTVGGHEPFTEDQFLAHASESGNAPDCSDPNLLYSHKSRRTSRANSPEWQIPWRYDHYYSSSFIGLHMDEDEYPGYGSETAQSHTSLTECQLAPNVADPSSTSMSRNQLTLRDLTPGQSKPYFPSRDTADHGFAQSPRTAATAKDSKIEGSENVFGAGSDLTGNSRRPPNSPQFNFETLSTTPESANQLLVEQNPFVRRLKGLQDQFAALDDASDSDSDAEPDDDNDCSTHDRTDERDTTGYRQTTHDPGSRAHGSGQTFKETGPRSGEPSNGTSSSSNDDQASNGRSGLLPSREDAKDGGQVIVATSDIERPQGGSIVIPCPLHSEKFPCPGYNNSMADLERALHSATHRKWYCHKCKRLFKTKELYKTHGDECSHHCVVPSCPGAVQSHRHRHNQNTCEKNQKLRKRAEYAYLCSLLGVVRDLEKGTAQDHLTTRNARKHLDDQGRKLAEDAVRKNVQLEDQLRSCQSQDVQMLKMELGILRLIVKHAMREIKKAGIVLPSLLHDLVKDHAKSALDSHSEESEHDITGGSNEHSRVDTPSSSSNQQHCSKRNRAVTANASASQDDGDRRKKPSTSTGKMRQDPTPQSPLSSSNHDHTFAPEAEQRNDAIGQQLCHDVPWPGRVQAFEPHAKRRRVQPTTERSTSIDPGEQLLNCNPLIAGPSSIPPAQNIVPYFPPGQESSQESHPQLQQHYASPSTEQGTSSLNDHHSLEDAGNSRLASDNAAWGQGNISSTTDHASMYPQADPAFSTQNGQFDATSQYTSAGPMDRQDPSTQPATENWVADNTSAFDDAFGDFNWSGVPLLFS